MENKSILSSCEYLLRESSACFIPEDFDEEMQMIAETCKEFLDTEIYPLLTEIDEKEDDLMPKLLRKSAEYGLLGLTIPQQFGGFELPFINTIKTGEVLGAANSFSVAHMCHVGIGSMPIVCYGNAAQKEKYLPLLASGEKFACFCLTEPNAGSDANAGRTQAIPTADGEYYILNGQKMFITNSGFADIQIVFAKIENDRVLSAFIVERDWAGITINPEEHKMGIRGTSTRQIFYNDVKIPAENLLGKRGEGYRIALNILHLGRIKLASLCLGSSKKAIEYSVRYANERKQFGKKIADFGTVKQMLAQQVILTNSCESALYRACGIIQDEINTKTANGENPESALRTAISDCQAECSMMKVFASESQDKVVDNAVQILGGIGYSAAMPVERAYRDSRINRIYEGTNEINKLLAVDVIMKKAIRNNNFPMFEMAEHLTKIEVDANTDFIEQQIVIIRNLKQICWLLMKAFHNEYGAKYAEEQESAIALFDIINSIFVAEASVLRVNKLKGTKQSDIYFDLAECIVFEQTQLVYQNAIELAGNFDNKELKKQIEQIIEIPFVNVKEKQRRIADKLIADNQYYF